MILDAIARHPDKAQAVAMVATDGVYFLSRHPELDRRLSEQMGDWSRGEKHTLTLFKPGVYWDDHSRELINAGKAPRFKARGINAQDFARSIADVDAMFDSWSPDEAPNVKWPEVQFRSRFSQVSVLQALQWTEGTKPRGLQEGKYRALAGQVSTGKKLEQNAEPGTKRNVRRLRFDLEDGVWRTEPWDHKGWPPSTAYERRFGVDELANPWDEYATPDGPVMLSFRETLYP
jgi:hypothetical protein